MQLDAARPRRTQGPTCRSASDRPQASVPQVYPEDRGANYAIRDGRRAAALIDAWLDRTTPGTFPEPRHC